MSVEQTAAEFQTHEQHAEPIDFHATIFMIKKDSPLAPCLESQCHIRNFLYKICLDDVCRGLMGFEPRSELLIQQQ